ncbi:MAG: T9SS type A sorting domain-containing protein, partial [Bacteroidota bacterium]
TNNDYFNIMRDVDGNDFEVIGSVEAIGNSHVLNEYTFTDRNPFIGTARYKIVQVDLNGDQDETEILSVNYDAPRGLSWEFVGPVPTRDFVKLSFLADENQTLNLQVVDMRGAIAVQQTVQAMVGSNSLQIDLSSLESGIYYLRLSGAKAHLEYKLARM